MIGFLIKITLIWWIISALFKWLGRQTASLNSDKQKSGPPVEEKDPGVVHSGTIEDAEFEEMDDR